MEIPGKLKQLYESGRVIPFVGAGVSHSVNWESDGKQKKGVLWAELVEKAAEQIGFKEISLLRTRGSDLQILEYYRLMKSDEWSELTNWFVREMYPSDEALTQSALHRALSNLDKCDLYYTTNFDDFLERALLLNGRSTNVICKESDIQYDDDKVDIVKFHGDINHPGKMVLSEKDYEERILMKSPLDYKLLSDMLNRVILFLGYSFRDPNISYLFRLFTNQIGQRLSGVENGIRAYIAVPYPSKFEKKLYRARKIEVIPIDNVELTKGYCKLLEELSS